MLTSKIPVFGIICVYVFALVTTEVLLTRSEDIYVSVSKRMIVTFTCEGCSLSTKKYNRDVDLISVKDLAQYK